MNKNAIFLLALSFVLASAYASTSLSGTENEFVAWIPIVLIAILVAILLTLIFYAIATLLGNARLKSAALYEFAQVIGTVVILLIIFGLFNIYSASVYGNYPKLTNAVSNICSPSQQNQLAGSPIDFLNPTIQGPTKSICGLAGGVPSSGVTQNIDYGLASTYAIIANVTSQAGMSLNDLNEFENFYNTLESVVPTGSVCWPAVTCSAPTGGLSAQGAGTGVSISYTTYPYYMYGKIRGGTLFINAEAELSFYTGLLELFATIVALFGWPYFLAAGLILRASFLTRRVGGLIIAVVLVALFLYPLLNLFEYSSLTNASSPLSAIGANVVSYQNAPLLQLKGQAPCTSLLSSCILDNTNPIIDYNTGRIDFYVFPRLDYILNYEGCWPLAGSLLASEVKIIGLYITPGVGNALALYGLIGSFVGSVPSFLIDRVISCSPEALLNSVLSLSNFYGQTFVFMVMLPVLNVLMLLSAVKGLSSLLGGDTSLLGLGRLV